MLMWHQIHDKYRYLLPLKRRLLTAARLIIRNCGKVARLYRFILFVSTESAATKLEYEYSTRTREYIFSCKVDQ